METFRRLVGTGMALVLVLVGGIGRLGADPTATEPQLIAATIFPYTSEQQDGFVDKVLKELARRAGGAQGIQAMPLGRALDEAKKRPSLLVPLGRNKDREEYLNYGPVIYDDSLLFVVRAGEKNSVPTLESAKGMAIGTHINSTTETFLRANGFQDINTAMDNSDLLKMLLAKHVDVIYVANGILRATANDKDFSRSAFEVALVVSKYPLYLAASKSVDPTVLARWAKLLEGMKADGTYAKLTAGF